MSLTIEIDPHGMSRVPFADLRSLLLETRQTFSDRELRLLPYSELILAALANAGASACTIEAVLAHKQARRRRFLSMSPDALAKAQRYLQDEGMYTDIQALVAMRDAPPWDTLTSPVRLWLKLNCLYTHIAEPEQRLRDAISLAAEAESASLLDSSRAYRMIEKLDRLRHFYPSGLSDDTFRTAIGCMSEEMLELLSIEEQEHCQRELVADYSCTGGCYHATGLNV